MLSHREQYDQDIKQKKTKKQELKKYLISQIDFSKINKDLGDYLFLKYHNYTWENFDRLSEIFQEGKQEKQLAKLFIENTLEHLWEIKCSHLIPRLQCGNIVWSKLYELWPCLIKTYSPTISIWGWEWYKEVEQEIINNYVVQKRDYSQRLLAFEKQVEIEEAKQEDFWAQFLDMEDIE